MTLPKFSFYNFKPRAGISDIANYLLEFVYDHAPSDSSCTAHIERIGENSYRFEITINSQRGNYTSSKLIDLDNVISNIPRQWQAEVLEDMCQDLATQLRLNKDRRFIA